jgi:hypothetical protein
MQAHGSNRLGHGAFGRNAMEPGAAGLTSLDVEYVAYQHCWLPMSAEAY